MASQRGRGRALLAAPTAEPGRSGARVVGAELPSVAFLCPGQGSQYPADGVAACTSSEPAFRAAYDDALRDPASRSGGDPRASSSPRTPQALVPTSVTQPAIFALEYALAADVDELGASGPRC